MTPDDAMTASIEVKLIAPSRLHPHPHNIRGDVGNITGLARSIRQSGLLQNLVVQRHPDLPGHFLILAGERRWTAGKKAGQKCLLCIVVAPQSRRGATVLMLGENGHRRSPNPMEFARAFGSLRDGEDGEEPMTLAQISAATAFSASSISRYLTLLELSAETQLAVESGDVSVTRALAAVRQHRATQRRRAGHKKPGGAAACEPDHFSRQHPLAADAKARCTGAGHPGRRKFAGACHQCWEDAIRDDTRQQFATGGDAPTPVTHIGGERVRRAAAGAAR
jgi:ParB family chromosome partitioning protein